MGIDAACHAARDFALVLHPHFLILQRVAGSPARQVRREPGAWKFFERREQLRQQRRDDGIAVRHRDRGAPRAHVIGGAARRSDGGARGLIQHHVQTQAHHQVHGPGGFRAHFEQDAAQLAVRRDQVVRPLEAHAGDAETGQGIHGGDSHDQAQRGKIGRQVRVLPGQRQADRATGRCDPRAATAAAAAGLVFRQHQRGHPGAWRRRFEQPGVARLERPLDQQRLDALEYIGRQQRLDALRRQRAHTHGQAVTLAGLRIERDTELAQLLDRLPHGGACDVEVSGECFTGLEGTIVQPLEHALRERPVCARWGHERGRPNSHNLRARGSLPSRMRRTLPRCV